MVGEHAAAGPAVGRRGGGGTDRRALEDRLRRTGRRHWLPHLTAYLARPFDLRYLVFTAEAVTRPRLALARHLRSTPNLALLVPRQHKEEAGAAISAALCHTAILEREIDAMFLEIKD